MPPDHVTPNALAAGDVMVIGAAADPDSDGPADELVPAAVVGFSLFELPDPDGTDGQQLAHLAQLSVHPRYGRRGLGRALLGGTVGRAAARGAAVLTLTTFADVPWNAPFYLRCGFIELPAERWPGYLRDHRNAEIKSGLDALGPRVALALPLR
jgi:GNAT superfamily N-acetyltransferase